MQLPKQPDPRELQALTRIAETQDGELMLKWLQRNANAYMEASLNGNDALSRQAQGGWVAVTSFLTTARSAQAPTRTE